MTVPSVRWGGTPPRRRGAVIAEMIVALVISCVVAALAASALLAAERRLRAGSGASDASRVEQDVELVLRSELRASLGDSVVLRGDTAIEVLAHVGTSVVCSWGGRVLTVPPSQSSTGVPLSRWRYTPAAGDLLYVSDSTTGAWGRYVVDSAVCVWMPRGVRHRPGSSHERIVCCGAPSRAWYSPVLWPKGSWWDLPCVSCVGAGGDSCAAPISAGSWRIAAVISPGAVVHRSRWLDRWPHPPTVDCAFA